MKWLTCICVVVFGVVLPCFGTTYYVAPWGSDSNGGSMSNPWRTLVHGIGQIGAGDTLYLREGFYHQTKQNIDTNALSASGSAGSPITIGGSTFFLLPACICPIMCYSKQ